MSTASRPTNRDVGIPKKYNWQNLKAKRGAEIEGHYIELLRALDSGKGMLGQNFILSLGGFFLTAYAFLVANYKLNKKQKEFIKHSTFHGNEIVANTRRLYLMNTFLHNIGEIDGQSSISPNDSLVADSGERYDYVLANPPFEKKAV